MWGLWSVPVITPSFGQAGSALAMSSQAATFLARATGVTTGTDISNYNNLITGLVSDGVWSKLDALYIFAAPNRATALLNLVQNTYNCVENGTVSFAAYQGYTGDASTFYLDTGLKPSASGINYAQNSASYGVYILTSRTTMQNYYAIGVGQTYNTSMFACVNRLSTPSFGAAVNEFATTYVANANAQGFYVATRTGASATSFYRNGNTTPIITGSNASGGLDSISFFVFGGNNGSNPLFDPTADQQSAAFIGGALTATDQQNLSNRINTFMTAYGINVY
jgi:hypothetical protein